MGLTRMQGKSVVVSGAALGIGRATRPGRRIPSSPRYSGAPLLALRDELQRNGARVEAVVGDISQVEDCQAIKTGPDRSPPPSSAGKGNRSSDGWRDKDYVCAND